MKRARTERKRERRAAARCATCGGKLREETVRTWGAVLPIGLMLLGSYLAFRFIGLVLLPLGGFLWTRTRRVEVCDACTLSDAAREAPVEPVR